jgi:hypothetical protein
MRSALLLMTVITLLGGCALGMSRRMPRSVDAELIADSVTFTVAAPPSGVLDPARVVRELHDRPVRSNEGEFTRRIPFAKTQAAAPIFGLLTCVGPPGSLCSTFQLESGASRGYYLVLYPDWVGPDGDVAWALVDAHLGAGPGQSITSHDPRPQPVP